LSSVKPINPYKRANPPIIKATGYPVNNSIAKLINIKSGKKSIIISMSSIYFQTPDCGFVQSYRNQQGYNYPEHG
jgi:hypothetical protein